MRLAQLHVRVLISLAFTVFLGAVAMLPRTSGPVLARPVAVGSPQLTPAASTRSTTPGTLVTHDFTLRNVGDTSDTFRIEIVDQQPIPGATANKNVGDTVVLSVNGQISIQVTVTIPSQAQVGAQDVRALRVTAQSSGSQVQAILTTTVVAATPTPTISPTPTGTPGPTPTPGPLCLDSFEPDNQPAQAKELRPDQPQTRAICPRGDEDWLVFGGVAGKVYTIDVTAMSNGLDLTLSLYDATGNLLAFNNDFPRNNNPYDIRPRIQSWRAPANGNYYIKVRDDAGRGDRNLTYTIELQSEAYGPTPTLIAEVCLDLFEPDGLPAQARLITIREIQPNKRFCPAGDADWVRFFAKAGTTYVLRTESQNRAGADPVLILVDRDGATLLDFNDDAGGTLDARIEFTPEVDGYYYAQAKNVGDVGNQFIIYDLILEPSGAPVQPVTPVPTRAVGTPTVAPGMGTPTPTLSGTPGTATATPTPTPTSSTGYSSGLDQLKGAPPFVNGPRADFVDPALRQVWERTDLLVATRKVDRSWMWGPSGLVARAEVYAQADGGVRQVQYFDKARMEITDWRRDRNNPWFVTNGLLVKELIEGQVQLGDSEFLARTPAAIAIAGDADDPNAPTYASLARHTAAVGNRVGQIATATLRRDGQTGTTAARPEATLVYYVPETGHNIPRVFWEFLNARGPIGDGSRSDVLVDWVFAMGYPISEPFWTRVKVGGVERDVLVQAFQRRVLTYTPANPAGWQVEMGNVGRHYYLWRYGRQP
ncbi:PPC domain-containing protein [Kallotenue papyrolyticum]|uniref:PPC domain-containing protein n=1 Tax=Kallotenue papyrolyticum TaxID=1325125 RepID=UPI0004785B40|nr:PPC domain-containing protein [Kallotenue papyrolyticum]